MKKVCFTMNKSLPAVIFAVLIGMFLAGCGLKVLPENELKGLNAQKILDLGAEKYSQYEYEEAVYYYNSIARLFPQDSEEVNDQKAWAKYEIAYIRYQQNRFDEALQQFNDVLKIKSKSTAPRILAAQMIEKLKARK